MPSYINNGGGSTIRDKGKNESDICQLLHTGYDLDFLGLKSDAPFGLLQEQRKKIEGTGRAEAGIFLYLGSPERVDSGCNFTCFLPQDTAATQKRGTLL